MRTRRGARWSSRNPIRSPKLRDRRKVLSSISVSCALLEPIVPTIVRKGPWIGMREGCLPSYVLAGRLQTNIIWQGFNSVVPAK